MDRGSQLSKDDEDDEEEEERRTRQEEAEEEEEEKEEKEEATDIKSNNPHLAGGEKNSNRWRGFPPDGMFIISHGGLDFFSESKHSNLGTFERNLVTQRSLKPSPGLLFG